MPTETELRKAFRKRALECHPDKALAVSATKDGPPNSQLDVQPAGR